MRSQHEERDRDARDRDEPEIDPVSGRKPVYFRPDPHVGQYTLRESAAAAWPRGMDAECQAVAMNHLEQVGRILERLDLDQREILQLRSETRTILAGLAA
jgi:hypothetical protein